MKKQVRYGLIVVSLAVILALAASSAIAFPQNTDNCSSCHTNSTGMTLSASPTSISVQPGSTFSIVMRAEGVSGSTGFTLRFSSEVADNSLFDFGSLGAEGTVDDGAAADEDSDDFEIEANYSIIAPDIAGGYTLHAFAAQSSGMGIDLTISVTVLGEGPSITQMNATPAEPQPTDSVTVEANVSAESGIDTVTLQYSIDNRTTWTDVSMTLSNGLYVGSIPTFPLDTHVIYRIVALDNDGAESISREIEYTVSLPPPPQLHYGWLLGGPALIFAYIGTALEYYDEERFTRIHGFMLSIAYILTSINVFWLFLEDASTWTAMNPLYLIDITSITLFIHSWHIWLGIISMILGTLAFLT
ncbi:MAG: hypothetical protein ACXAEF_09910, partial [Candidatus Thorarchaeota archaeon]